MRTYVGLFILGRTKTDAVHPPSFALGGGGRHNATKVRDYRLLTSFAIAIFGQRQGLGCQFTLLRGCFNLEVNLFNSLLASICQGQATLKQVTLDLMSANGSR